MQGSIEKVWASAGARNLALRCLIESYTFTHEMTDPSTKLTAFS